MTSFGLSCDEEFPEVYAKVPDPATIKWINSVIEEFGGNICSIPKRNDEWIQIKFELNILKFFDNFLNNSGAYSGGFGGPTLFSEKFSSFY